MSTHVCARAHALVRIQSRANTQSFVPAVRACVRACVHACMRAHFSRIGAEGAEGREEGQVESRTRWFLSLSVCLCERACARARAFVRVRMHQ